MVIVLIPHGHRIGACLTVGSDHLGLERLVR
jgi:hypothetical protein